MSILSLPENLPSCPNFTSLHKNLQISVTDVTFCLSSILTQRCVVTSPSKGRLVTLSIACSPASRQISASTIFWMCFPRTSACASGTACGATIWLRSPRMTRATGEFNFSRNCFLSAATRYVVFSIYLFSSSFCFRFHCNK